MIFGLEMCALEAKSSFALYFVSHYVNEFHQLLQTILKCGKINCWKFYA